MKGSTTLQNRHYTYYNSGDIDTVTDNLTGVTYDYTYDDLHRLTDETNTGGFGAMHVAYDAIGNMTQGYDFSNPPAIRLRTITYNVDNMPTSIVHGSGKTAALLYDGAGARAKKTVTGGTASTTYYIGNHFEVKNGVATKYFFAGNLRVAQMVGSTVSYFHKDHLGSSTVMTNTSGVLVESTNFEPFGGQRAHTGTDTSAYKFTDQEFDAENGLYNYDARMYDPVVGRFISPDSIVPDLYNPQALNRYSYCRNNPLIYTDPTGHYDIFTLPEVVVHGFYNIFDDPLYRLYGNNLYGLLAGPALWLASLFGGSTAYGAENNPTPVATSASASGKDVILDYGEYTETRTGGTRSWRNSNPGNIKMSDYAKKHGAIGEAGGFAVFPDYKTGFNALTSLLKGDSYNKLTISSAIKKYAPPNENYTSNYESFIYKQTGLNPNTLMGSLNDTQLVPIHGNNYLKKMKKAHFVLAF